MTWQQMEVTRGVEAVVLQEEGNNRVVQDYLFNTVVVSDK